MTIHRNRPGRGTHVALAGAALAAVTATATAERPWADVSKDYEKVISTADGKSLYGVWINKKDNQLLAELPRGWQRQKHLFAVTQASGGVFAGLQGPTIYAYWKQYGDRLALIAPEIGTRSTGEAESKSSVDRLFTDRVLFDVAVISKGPAGQPVIDLDDMLVKQGPTIGGARSTNPRLVSVASAKAFPQNIEIALEAPGPRGAFVTTHFSISQVPESNGYKPRMADERVGYFTTVYRDLGMYDREKKWARYIDRWHVEKRDPKLRLSPPKEPIIYYIEHTVPVRYRRYLKQGINYWNDAFRKIGIDGAIEVYYQDKATGAHMEKDPEDVRYNFIRWLNNDISTAIGPHRAHPLTGQILDADVVLTDGWIRAYYGWFHDQAPELAVESFSADTLRWLDENPQWDPRILLAAPEVREQRLAARAARRAAGEPLHIPDDPALMEHAEHAAIAESLDDAQHYCMAAHGLAFDMAFARLSLEMLDVEFPEFEGEEGEPIEKLDGVPEYFVGPLLAELVCHEVGHTLGLRHNFKASSIYTMAEINSEAIKGKKPLAGSVMDYLPPNFNMESGDIQGDFAMIGIGPYDFWAIEYGYTFGDPKEVAKRAADPVLAYQTDDDTGGPDPLARRYDMSKNPIEYAANQMRVVTQQRERLLDRFVEDGESYAKSRQAYQATLSMQTRMLSMMANWVGGSFVSRARKGDPDAGAPIVAVPAEEQRRALDFVIENTMHDEAFGLTPELLTYMTVDKWSDQSPGDRGDPTWQVHERIMSIQQSVLTMIMNPTTLSRVFDNEWRTAADDDAVTLPEVMGSMVGAVYGELDTELNGETFTVRSPMISSMRRNLQSGMADRLIALADGDGRLPRAIRTLALSHLKDLDGRIGGVLDQREGGQIDIYTIAHLEDLHERIQMALNRVYVAK